jgi:Skp family chaperone for outer membrane proteins
MRRSKFLGLKGSFDQLGWIFAAAMAGVMLASGFQSPTDKTGVADISKIIEGSNAGKANQTQFGVMKQARQDFLEFIDQNRVLTTEQAQRLHDLAIKENRTEAENAEMARIKADVVDQAKRSQDLAGKQTLTPEDRNLMDEYSRRSQAMNTAEERWYNEFTSEMQDWADKRKLDLVQKARDAISQVAKSQGYTVVFEVGIAPYGANDLTDSALQAMNAAK